LNSRHGDSVAATLKQIALLDQPGGKLRDARNLLLPQGGWRVYLS
jgi:hypothetical protein